MSTQYAPTKEVSYIQYIDSNNLYGWAMFQAPPKENKTLLVRLMFAQQRERLLATIKGRNSASWTWLHGLAVRWLVKLMRK